ncbi:MAG: hypothetical protein ACI9LN_004474 [Saprospiraceae bacterium]|jgi:hypothetical protein
MFLPFGGECPVVLWYIFSKTHNYEQSKNKNHQQGFIQNNYQKFAGD